jgi:hypothetical protein
MMRGNRGALLAHAPTRCRARWQGVAGEHRWGPRVAPGKKIGGGAHPIDGVLGGQWGGAVRCWSMAVEQERWSPTTGP